MYICVYVCIYVSLYVSMCVCMCVRVCMHISGAPLHARPMNFTQASFLTMFPTGYRATFRKCLSELAWSHVKPLPHPMPHSSVSGSRPQKQYL